MRSAAARACDDLGRSRISDSGHSIYRHGECFGRRRLLLVLVCHGSAVQFAFTELSQAAIVDVLFAAGQLLKLRAALHQVRAQAALDFGGE
jgi:hypothetical protein